MDNFQSLSKDKIEIVIRLLQDEKLVQCLANNQSDFLNYPVTDKVRDNLIYTQIFPYNTIQGLQNEAKSYITMKFRFSRTRGANIFKNFSITFYLFCEDSLVKTDYGCLRYDYMLQRVDALFNDTRGSQWIGKMMCESVEDAIIDSEGKYLGIVAKYVNTEFM